MATYSYECRNSRCRDKFAAIDVDKHMTDATPELCPCCKRPMSKLISSVGIQFKGKGFHVNDYPTSKR
jgi:putative FmdB family regulatory protein